MKSIFWKDPTLPYLGPLPSNLAPSVFVDSIILAGDLDSR